MCCSTCKAVEALLVEQEGIGVGEHIMVSMMCV